MGGPTQNAIPYAARKIRTQVKSAALGWGIYVNTNTSQLANGYRLSSVPVGYSEVNKAVERGEVKMTEPSMGFRVHLNGYAYGLFTDGSSVTASDIEEYSDNDATQEAVEVPKFL